MYQIFPPAFPAGKSSGKLRKVVLLSSHYTTPPFKMGTKEASVINSGCGRKTEVDKGSLQKIIRNIRLML